MPLTNLPVFAKMLTDGKLRRFLKENRSTNRSVPAMPVTRQLKLYSDFMRGERILRFNGRYNIISLLPPLPSKAFARFLASSRDNIFSRGGGRRPGVSVSVTLAMTDRCSYNCVHCGIKLRNGGEMSTGEWIKVIGNLVDMGTTYIAFSGGEPLLRGDMEEIIASLDDRCVAYLFTNGKELTPARARSLKQAGLWGLSVSLESADPKTHNRMRRTPQAFEHAVSAVRASRAAGLYTIAQAVVFRRDLDRRKLFKLFKLAKSYGAHEFRILKPAQAGSLLDAEDDGIFYTSDDDLFLGKIQLEANRRWGMPKVTCFPFSEIGKFDCNAGIRHSYITPQGEWTPCDFVPLSFGNVLREDMRVIWRRMNEAVGVPKRNCWSKALAPCLRGRKLTVPTEESVKLAKEARDRELARIM